MLVEILRGAGDKAGEAGIAIVGGHTIQSEEPIFGLAVVGKVHPDQVITNAGAQPGDFLVLSKPLGLGIITTAAKRGEDSQGAIAEAHRGDDDPEPRRGRRHRGRRAHAMTDVTGLRPARTPPQHHGRQRGLGDDLERPGARSCRRPGTTCRPASPPAAPTPTAASSRDGSSTIREIPEWQQLLLCDAQTSGGLLAALPGTHAAEVVRHLRYHGLESAAVVGCIEAGDPGRIRVHLSPESAPH